MIVFSHYESDSRVKREAQSLSQNGYNIMCISLGEKKEKKIKIYDSNITVIKKMHWLHRFKKGSFIRYLIGCTLFFFVSFIEMLKIHSKHKINLIHIHNPPDHLTFIALPFKLLYNSKIILDRHEPFAIHFISKIGFSLKSVLFSFLLAYEKLSYLFIDAIITINDIERLDVKRIASRKKIVIIKNSLDITLFQKSNVNNLSNENRDEYIILYQGIISLKRDIDTLIYAVKKIITEIPDLKCYIIGNGDYLDEAINLTEKLSLEKTFIFSKKWLKQCELIKLMAKADIFLLTLKDIPVYHRAAPNKLFEYMYLNKPIIAANLPIIRKLTENTCYYYQSENPNDLGEKILMLRKNPDLFCSEKGNYNEILKNNAWEIEEKKLLLLYQELEKKH